MPRCSGRGADAANFTVGRGPGASGCYIHPFGYLPFGEEQYFYRPKYEVRNVSNALSLSFLPSFVPFDNGGRRATR